MANRTGIIGAGAAGLLLREEPLVWEIMLWFSKRIKEPVKSC